MENNALIKTDQSHLAGYHPLHVTPQWQVAILKHQKGGGFFDIHRLDIHHFTDESFILARGRAALVAARIKEDMIEYEISDMQPGIIYTIPANCWHNIGQTEDAEVIIIENAQTHLWDFEFYNLSQTSIKYLNELIKEKMNL
ncbi:hypothetical protein [Coprobacter tertius]|uniref:Sugar 3,4-ketoisomerase QdtA cupin domain-containing protein n=1 Tax=Coprobacter tertius TaxID=2944915 RepID=A0ABT1MDL8_9BACT|nr:hypothetical protein [Coprobacter tertius]MCP9610710.1 hypothetical protein [Coprobacter tertius]